MALFQESGSPYDIPTMEAGQTNYDRLVNITGCGSSEDSLSCLKTVPYDTLIGAVNTMAMALADQALNLAWAPRIDGLIFTESPGDSVKAGRFAKIPIISGDCDDEGT